MIVSDSRLLRYNALALNLLKNGKRKLPIPKRFASGSSNRHDHEGEIARLNIILKQKLAEIEAAEAKKKIEAGKTKLSDFKRPILLTFLIASTLYLSFHWLWWTLRYDARETELKNTVQQIEEELEAVRKNLPELEDGIETDSQKKWYHKLKFWK